MATIEINVSGIYKLQKRMAKLVTRILPQAGTAIETLVKFGLTKGDIENNTEAFKRARDFYTKRLRREKRRERFLRKYRRRGEKMERKV
jgi:hypothetical protein